MTDSKESFPRLLGEKYHRRLISGIAELELPWSSMSRDVSQHDKSLIDVFCEVINWIDQVEERKFTGDPLDLPPDHPAVPLMLSKLGLLDATSSEQV